MTGQRLHLTDEQVALLEQVRQEVLVSEVNTEYACGVIDALAFVWAGLPEDPAKVYEATNRRFSELMDYVEMMK